MKKLYFISGKLAKNTKLKHYRDINTLSKARQIIFILL